MAALTPAVHSGWRKQKWSSQVIETLFDPLVFSSRVEDRSAEVTGMEGQVLTIPRMSALSTYATGDNGEVTDQTPAAPTETLTIDQNRHVALKFRNDYALQVAVSEGKWSREQGQALKLYMEQYGLDLEQGVGSGSRRSIAGSITEADLLALRARVERPGFKWPKGNWHLAMSPDQMTQVLALDRFSELTFVGDGNAPVTTGNLKTIYGFEPLVTGLAVRRSVSGTTRTINMAWHGDRAFCKGMQKDITVEKDTLELWHRITAWFLFGMALKEADTVYILQSTDA